MKKIQLVIPMSGKGSRFKLAGYAEIKPLISINGEPMISRVLSVFPVDWECTFILSEEQRASELPNVLKKCRPKAKLVYVEPHSLGPGRAIESALAQLREDAPVFVSYCDYGMLWSADQFEHFVATSECDACVVTYRGFHPHYLSPLQYAYCRLDGERVVEVKEKGSFTPQREREHASTGGYYFRNRALLTEALKYQRQIGLAHNGEFYTSLTVEALLRNKPDSHVRVFEISKMFQWGTPDELENFAYWERNFRAYQRLESTKLSVDQVLMPMAGQGTRFSEYSSTPKPFLDIDGQMMFERSLASLPQGKETTVVIHEALRNNLAFKSTRDLKVVSLPVTPPGQALSTEAGLKSLNPNKEVFISSCDHAIVLSPEIWTELKRSQFDAAIFTIRNYPGVRRTPEAYAYVQTEGNAPDGLSEVKRVSVKKAFTERPWEQDLLVGSFWFRNVKLAMQAIEQLKARDLRVNGELYLDSVFSLLIEAGKRVARAPLVGYLGFGDPSALAEMHYWHDVFIGTRPDARKAG